MYNLGAAVFTTESALKGLASRYRTVSQNLANKNTTALSPEGSPYRRKTIFFHSVYDYNLDAEVIQTFYGQDPSKFLAKFEPSHPAADAEGYVLYPNVEDVIEIGDIRETSISYQANLGALVTARNMINKVMEMLSGQ